MYFVALGCNLRSDWQLPLYRCILQKEIPKKFPSTDELPCLLWSSLHYSGSHPVQSTSAGLRFQRIKSSIEWKPFQNPLIQERDLFHHLLPLLLPLAHISLTGELEGGKVIHCSTDLASILRLGLLHSLHNYREIHYGLSSILQGKFNIW